MSSDHVRTIESAFLKSAPLDDHRSAAARVGRDEAMLVVPTTVGPLSVQDEGNAAGPVALLWPSLFTDHRMWRDQATALRAEGWRTLAVDPPGHGRSPGPGRGFTMDECAEAVVQLLDARGIRTPIVMLGTSWGGFVAPRVALLAPDRVPGLVLFNTSAARPPLLHRAKALLLTKLFAVERLDDTVCGMITSPMLCSETKRSRPELASELASDLRAWDRRGVLTTVRSVLVDRESMVDALPRVKAPALVVSGKEDPLFPAAHAQRIVEQLSNSRHVEVAGAAHLVPLEQPQVATSLVLDFVRQLPTS